MNPIPAEIHESETESGGDEFEYKERFSRRIVRFVLINTAVVLVIVCSWEVVSHIVKIVRGIPFPSPSDTLNRLLKLIQGETLYGSTILDHLRSSIYRWAVGYSIAAVSGILIGVVSGLSRIVRDLVMPIVYIIQLIPGLAWIPIALLLFGLGETSTIFMISITSLTPVIINTSGGIQGVPLIYIRVARMMGYGRGALFVHVLLPASLMAVLNGLRIGLANGWRVLIAAEMIVGVGVGLGYSIIQSRWSLDFEAALACVLLICAVGLVVEKGFFSMVERKVVRHLGEDIP